MEHKGRSFDGAASGASYLFWTRIFGFTPSFYANAAEKPDFPPGVTSSNIIVLDLGCGPGPLSFALARKLEAGATIYGLDISSDQIAYAQQHSHSYPCSLTFSVASMDEIPFCDSYFDLVMTSMALHETPPSVRRKAIAEAARVLKPEGRFLLIDWCRPRIGLLSLIWLPMLLVARGKDRDNWDNVYKTLCEQQNMTLADDRYINSIARRQVFIKK